MEDGGRSLVLLLLSKMGYLSLLILGSVLFLNTSVTPLNTGINYLNMKFETGEILFSRGVYALMESSNTFAKFVLSSLERHKKGDWGDVCLGDQKANDDALINQSRLISAYLGAEKIWIITEWNRSITTILFPKEY